MKQSGAALGKMIGNTPRHRAVACPHCGQNMPAFRKGVRLTPVLALIYDRVSLAGPDGIEGHELRAYLTRATGRDNVSRSLAPRIKQLNEIIEDIGERVIPRREMGPGGNRRLQTWWYYLKKT